MQLLTSEGGVKKLHSELEIIFITADAQPGDREYALSAGAIGFLQKPFEEASLLDLLPLAINNYH